MVMGRRLSIRHLYEADHDRVYALDCDLCSGEHYAVICDCEGCYRLDDFQGEEPKELACAHCGLVVTVSEDDAKWFRETLCL